jgi:bacterioferritin (cytochrome b1)
MRREDTYERRVSRKLVDRLFERIKHGDEEHQRWLREALDKFRPDIERELALLFEVLR